MSFCRSIFSLVWVTLSAKQLRGFCTGCSPFGCGKLPLQLIFFEFDMPWNHLRNRKQNRNHKTKCKAWSCNGEERHAAGKDVTIWSSLPFFFTHRAVVKTRKAFFSERWEETKAEENPKVCTSWGPIWSSLPCSSYHPTEKAFKQKGTEHKRRQVIDTWNQQRSWRHKQRLVLRRICCALSSTPLRRSIGQLFLKNCRPALERVIAVANLEDKCENRIWLYN